MIRSLNVKSVKPSNSVHFVMQNPASYHASHRVLADLHPLIEYHPAAPTQLEASRSK